METLMQELAKKLYAAREREPFAKNNYVTLLKTVFGRKDLDDSLNEDAELAEAVTKAMSSLHDIEKYVLEEMFLHGKSQKQLSDEFRGNLDVEILTDKLIEDALILIKTEFMERMDLIFCGMEDNSFRELEYRDGVHPDGLPQNDTYYELYADKTVLDILRESLQWLDGCGTCYKDIFERYYLRNESKEKLADWISEHMENVVHDYCLRGLRKMRVSSNSWHLKMLVGYVSRYNNNTCSENKSGRCLYKDTIGLNDETTVCSLCKDDKIKKWMGRALSELPTEEQQIISLLYRADNDEIFTYKDVAVKLRIESKERVEGIAKSALILLREKAWREIL